MNFKSSYLIEYLSIPENTFTSYSILLYIGSLRYFLYRIENNFERRIILKKTYESRSTQFPSFLWQTHKKFYKRPYVFYRIAVRCLNLSEGPFRGLLLYGGNSTGIMECKELFRIRNSREGLHFC